MELDNWKTQIRKGYLELCLLSLIQREGRLYGFDILDHLRRAELEISEGTLYPLLNRMTNDTLLIATWETENLRGHPRKFYALTQRGLAALAAMRKEFEQMSRAYDSLSLNPAPPSARMEST